LLAALRREHRQAVRGGRRPGVGDRRGGRRRAGGGVRGVANLVRSVFAGWARAVMTQEDRQEALSLAYVKVIAAFSGMTYSNRSKDYGIDLTLHDVQRRGPRFFETGLHLDIQVKSTTAATVTAADIGYDLAVKNYDDLRCETDQPRILALMVLPPDS